MNASTTPARTALVLGATGGIGGAVARGLARDGWRVRALTRDAHAARAAQRGPERLDWIEGDAMARADVTAAAEGAEVLVHAVSPPGYRRWDELVLPMVDNTIAAARAAGGARVVLPGTVYNHDPAAAPVIDEATPQGATTRKGRIRVELERRLDRAAPGVPSLVLRAGDFFGPGARASWFSQAMVKPGRPVARVTSLAPGVPHAYAYLPDLAEAFVRLIDGHERLRPVERAQFPGHWDASGHEMLDAIRRVVGREVPERAFPWWLMRLLAPFGGFAREAVEIEPVWRHPMRLDGARLTALLGEVPHTPLDEAVRRTLEGLGALGTAASAGRAAAPRFAPAVEVRSTDRRPE